MVDKRQRVVVTGFGALSPVGNSAAESWAAVVAGQSGVATITRFDPTDYETRFAGEVKGFDPDAILGKKESRRMDRHAQLGVAAALEARGNAGLADVELDVCRVGVLMGSGMGAMETLEQGAETLLTKGPGRIGPFFAPMSLPNMAAGMAAIFLGAKGPCFGTVSACASSAHAIGESVEMIRRGVVDVMYAGGAEAPVTRLSVAGFGAMGALSKRNDAPERASRPFDADRDGFVLGEGAAVLVLERLEHAEKRGATILAEVAGYAATDDANHMVQPAPDGEGVGRAMRLALADAGLTPGDIGYLNAHATSTRIGEKYETQAIKSVFGERAYQLPISSTKSMTGHLLGAAGSLEATFCINALRSGCLPPTINYETIDPECDLNYIPNTAREAKVRAVMNNSLGFGGHNVSVIFTAT
ncbi:MAG TPA: beta-ketoacyl-ACP synthase II [Thermomicrobiales bacterium]|nr:beta-ketoacyl-ACP synthase II [Thermomicrobiales bacterium]